MGETAKIELRGAWMEVSYRRTDDDVEWWFLDERLNDALRLTGQERRDIRRELLGQSS